MVGHRFIEDLLDKSDAANFVLPFSVKNRASLMTAYTSRLLLSPHRRRAVAGARRLLRETGIKVLVGERAITINRQEKVITPAPGAPFFMTS